MIRVHFQVLLDRTDCEPSRQSDASSDDETAADFDFSVASLCFNTTLEAARGDTSKQKRESDKQRSIRPVFAVFFFSKCHGRFETFLSVLLDNADDLACRCVLIKSFPSAGRDALSPTPSRLSLLTSLQSV